MRRKENDEILIFNGRDGEWLARLFLVSKKVLGVEAVSQVRPQTAESTEGPTLLFAPVKKEPLAFLIQKATELGVKTLQPILTQYTAHPHLNLERLKAIAIEAAEQSRRLSVPEILKPVPFATLKDKEKYPSFFYLDESHQSPLISKEKSVSKSAIFILGPEGGFSKEEFAALKTAGGRGVSLGPLTLRAETAGLAVLAYLACVE